MLANHNAIESGGYVIDHSLRFSAASSQRLTRTAAIDSTTITWSFWVKRGALGTRQHIMGWSNGSSASVSLEFTAANQFEFSQFSTTFLSQKITTRLFRDTSAWLHIVVVLDTTNATAEDRNRIYVNGERITSFSTSTNFALNQTTSWGTAFPFDIGNQNGGASYLDGYLADFHVIAGQALTPSSFGETNIETGEWVAKPYTGTYGTNGFYLDFADGTSTTTLGYDAAGSNNWALTNFTRSAGVNDCWMKDVPAGNGEASVVQPSGNYAVLNPLDTNRGSPVLSNANLTLSDTASLGTWGSAASSIVMTTGKWYFEATASGVVTTTPATNTSVLVAVTGSETIGAIPGTAAPSVAYWTSGEKIVNNVITAYGASFTTEVIGCAFDADARTVEFFKNNVSQGVISIDASLFGYKFAVAAAWASAGRPFSNVNFGQRSFAYTPPTGFKALCTLNLPTPAIKRGDAHFDAVLDTGANILSATQALYTNELAWIKDRANTSNHQLVDSIRGALALQSNTTAAETTYSAPSGNSVGWVWRASDSAPVSNTSGSITSQVSANTTAGFSIVTYTGTGANATVGHGLGKVPKFIIVKDREGANDWAVYHAANTAAPETDYLLLNSTAATADDNTYWNDTAPTSSVFSIGTNADVNSANDFVAYCFAEIEGYSKFGSYTGNGSADGPFVFTGFKPKFLMIKSISAGGDNWVVLDNARSAFNVSKETLSPNVTSTESSTNCDIDFLSNGFKIRHTPVNLLSHNNNGGVYIYAAFAECPINYSNSR